MKYYVHISQPIIMVTVEKEQFTKFSSASKALHGDYKTLTDALVKVKKAEVYLGVTAEWQQTKPHQKVIMFRDEKGQLLLKTFMSCMKMSN